MGLNEGVLVVTKGVSTISNCSFVGHLIGISSAGGSLQVYNTSFYGNGRSGLILTNAPFVEISNCSFFDNSAPSSSYAAAFTSFNSATIISRNNLYTRNLGGAVLINSGNFSSFGDVFFNNSGAEWGAIRANSANLLIKDTLFDRNSANTGGALKLIDTEMIINNSNFTSNSASSSPALVYGASSTQKITLDGCLFDRNRGNYVSSFSGGRVEMKRCTFINNVAPEHASAVRVIGTIANITSCSFRNNSLTSSSNGGGVLMVDNAQASISNCDFVDNVGDSNSAIIFTRSRTGVRRVFNSTFVRNTAKFYSTIALWGATADIDYCTFLFNSDGGVYARDGSSASLSRSLFANNTHSTYGVITILSSNATVRGCSFDGNIGSSAGAFYVIGSNLSIRLSSFTNNVGLSGGGVYVSSPSSLHISSTQFSNNIARSIGGGVYVGSSVVSTLENVTCDGNYATVYGGCLASSSTSSVIISSSSITSNIASSSGAGSFLQGRAILTDSYIYNNTGMTSGGGIGGIGANITIANLRVNSNKAGSGGGIHLVLGYCIFIISLSSILLFLIYEK